MERKVAEDVKSKLETLLIEMGFHTISINGENVYEYKSTYYKLTFVEGLESFVIESAGSEEEARSNMYEDGDLFSISLGEKELLRQFRETLNEYYLN